MSQYQLAATYDTITMLPTANIIDKNGNALSTNSVNLTLDVSAKLPYFTGGQAVNDNANTIVTFDAASRSDAGAPTWNGSDTCTVQKTGLYLITAFVGIGGNDNTSPYVYALGIYVNGNFTVTCLGYIVNNICFPSFASTVPLNSGDTVQLNAYWVDRSGSPSVSVMYINNPTYPSTAATFSITFLGE